MNAVSLISILAGLVSAAASLLAAGAAKERKRKEGTASKALQAYWWAAFAYGSAFTVVQFSGSVGWGVEVPLYYAATVFGASTLVSLVYILFGILYGPTIARMASEASAMAAFVTVFLIFFFGVEGPIIDEWGVGLLSTSVAARYLVACFYFAIPLILAATVLYATRNENPVFRKRVLLFIASVLLFYMPNAYRYVFMSTGSNGALLATIMAIGQIVGWRSYHIETMQDHEHVENG